MADCLGGCAVCGSVESFHMYVFLSFLVIFVFVLFVPHKETPS